MATVIKSVAKAYARRINRGEITLDDVRERAGEDMAAVVAELLEETE